MLLRILLAVATCAGLLLAQPNELNLRQDPPAAIQSPQVNAVYTGTAGGTTYYYWISVRYPIGFSMPVAPVVVARAASSLGGGNSVALTWPAMPGASSYDVLRTSTPAAPSTCTCAVTLATTSATVTDSGGALSAWPPVGLHAAGSANMVLQINNRDGGAPYITMAVQNAQRTLNYQLGLLKNGPAPDYVPSGFIQAYANRYGRLACIDSTGADCLNNDLEAIDFGARGDGVTDDTAALNAAVAQACATGRTLRIGSGVYLHTGLTFPDPCDGASIIGQSNYSPSVDGGTELRYIGADGGVAINMFATGFVYMSRLTVDGNNKAGYGIKISTNTNASKHSAQFNHYEFLTVKNVTASPGRGISLENTDSSGGEQDDVSQNKFDHILAKNVGTGFYLSGAQNTLNYVYNCTVLYNVYGFYAAKGDLRILDNYISPYRSVNTQLAGIYVGTGVHVYHDNGTWMDSGDIPTSITFSFYKFASGFRGFPTQIQNAYLTWYRAGGEIIDYAQSSPLDLRNLTIGWGAATATGRIAFSNSSNVQTVHLANLNWENQTVAMTATGNWKFINDSDKVVLSNAIAAVGSMTSGSPLLNATTAVFVPFVVNYQCLVNGATGGSPANLLATVTGYNGTSQIILNSNATADTSSKVFYCGDPNNRNQTDSQNYSALYTDAYSPSSITGAWKKYRVWLLGGQWYVNNGNPQAPAAATSQNITLLTLPANGFVEAMRWKTFNACSGPSTIALTSAGVTGSSSYYVSGASYDLKTAASNTNLTSPTMAAIGSNTAASTSITIGMNTTGGSINTIAEACGFDVYIKWAVLP